MAFANSSLICLAVCALLVSPVWAEPLPAAKSSCQAPPYMKDGRNRGNHSHPNVKVLLYKRNPDPSRPTHYPVLTLRPDKGLGIQQVRLHEPEGNSTGEAYREIHAHDRSGKLHVEHNSAHRYRLCDLIALWSSEPRFRNIWRNTSAGGSVHVWIGKYHVPHIRLEDLLRIPLDHESSITICIEESVPV